MKQMKWMLAVMLMLLALMATGCQKETPTAQTEQTEQSEIEVTDSRYPIVFTDFFGDEVTIDAMPEKIISMAPEMTETIYALGAGDRMIGRSEYCDYPAETTDVPTFGTLMEMNIEAMVAADPDVVFMSSITSEEVTKALKDSGLTVVCLSYKGDLDKTYDYIMQLGDILDKQEEAKAITDDMKERIAAVVKTVEGQEKPTVYYVVAAGEYGDYTATGDTFIHGILTLAGGDNIAAGATGWSYTIEQLIEQDPYYILIPEGEGLKEQMETFEGYKDLTAVKEGRLYEVNTDLFSLQGPRIADGVETAAAIFYPELF